jgi:hypothetical protein
LAAFNKAGISSFHFPKGTSIAAIFEITSDAALFANSLLEPRVVKSVFLIC